LRAAQVLVRDTDRGTWPEEDVEKHLDETPGQFRLTRLFRVAGGRLPGGLALGPHEVRIIDRRSL
jgi:hypothetical protein